MVVDPEGPVTLELPNQWMWDIIDEFVYQVCLIHSYILPVAWSNTVKRISVQILFYVLSNVLLNCISPFFDNPFYSIIHIFFCEQMSTIASVASLFLDSPIYMLW